MGRGGNRKWRYAQFCSIYQHGSTSYRDVFFELPIETAFPKIVIHLAANSTKAEYSEEWFTNFTKAGGEFDIIGLSYYPWWHGSLQSLLNNMKNLKSVFPDKDVWLVETAYYWTNTSKSLENGPFDQTEDGQYAFLEALRLMLLKDYGYDTVVFYFGSHWTQPKTWMKCYEEWKEVAERALFNDLAQALKGIYALVGGENKDR